MRSEEFLPNVANDGLDIQEELDKAVAWVSKKLKLKTKLDVELSQDTKEAQGNHHTGGHVMGSDKIWIYAKNRNMCDWLRTLFHEAAHVRQGELGQLKPGVSYPGSPVEREADAIAGLLIKLYGTKNNYIFQ